MDLRERMKYIGYVVHYIGECDGGAYVPALAGGWVVTAQAMIDNRPGVTIVIEPVTTIPDWVEN